MYGFPIPKGPWCNGYLKRDVLNRSWVSQQGGVSTVRGHSNGMSSVDYGVPDTLDTVLHRRTQGPQAHGFSNSALNRGADINIVQYLGIAADEPERIARHTKPGFLLPLVEAGWDEAYCRQWCEERGLLSPIYESTTRGGCWFCHNQRIDQLRSLRRDYPDLWSLLLKWDSDSPTTFSATGRTVHDFDRRFQAEDKGLVPLDARFRWKMLEQLNSENCSE